MVWTILRHHLVHLYSSKWRNWIHCSLRNDEFTCFVWVMVYLSSKSLSCDPCLAVNPHLTGHTSFRAPSVCDKRLDRDSAWRWRAPTCPHYVTSYTHLHQRQWLLRSYLMCYHYSIKSIEIHSVFPDAKKKWPSEKKTYLVRGKTNLLDQTRGAVKPYKCYLFLPNDF